jgi:ribosome modulation factor
VTARDKFDAIQAGRKAAVAGRPVTDCPYPPGVPLRAAWVRGYVSHPATSAKVDYSN